MGHITSKLLVLCFSWPAVSSAQVAFGFGGGGALIRTFGTSKGASRSSGETSSGMLIFIYDVS